jgi:hypothetical protein
VPDGLMSGPFAFVCAAAQCSPWRCLPPAITTPRGVLHCYAGGKIEDTGPLGEAKLQSPWGQVAARGCHSRVLESKIDGMDLISRHAS